MGLHVPDPFLWAAYLFGAREPGCEKAVNAKVYLFQTVGCGTNPSYLAHSEAKPGLIMIHAIRMSQPVETQLFQDHSVVNHMKNHGTVKRIWALKSHRPSGVLINV